MRFRELVFTIELLYFFDHQVKADSDAQKSPYDRPEAVSSKMAVKE